MYLRFICVAISGFLAVHASESISENCANDLKSMRVGVRHIEGRGIGYNHGYTTLETFLASPPDLWPVMPFMDVRGHLFDNGKWAANAGLGLRGVAWNRVFGTSVYYDYRNTKKQNYNQVSFCLETFGKWVDARINGYFPVGTQISSPYNLQFARFAGNNLFVSQKFQYALTGGNGEMGVHLPSYKDFNFYTAAGPYYLIGKIGTGIWGGEIRLNGNYKNYVTLEVSYSYDRVFKNVVQGQLGINIPFGPKSGAKKGDTRTCSQRKMLNYRMLLPVNKNEIIPTTSSTEETIGINPATRQPWVFWFVDNTSHSAGTVESPFATLLDAQYASSKNEAIYIFPGDGTTAGLSNGITLQNSQILCGAGTPLTIPTTLGQITIPPEASGLPMLTYALGNIVTLANNNTISGLSITTASASSSGLYGDGIANLIVKSSAFTSPTSITTNGIALANSTGTVLVDNTSFSGFTCTDGSINGNGIYIEAGALDTLNITANNFNTISNPSNSNYGGAGVLTNGPLTTFTSSKNTFSNFSQDSNGIYSNDSITNFTTSGDTLNNFDSSQCIYNNGSITNFTMSGNAFSNLTTSVCLYNNNSITNLTASDNTFNTITSGGVFYTGGSMINFISSGNTFSNLTNSYGIALGGGLVTTLTSSNDTFSNLSASSNGISIGNSITTFTSSGNTFSNISYGSTGILTSGSIDTLILSGNIFNNINTNFSYGVFNNGSITTFISSDNTFNDMDNSGYGIFNYSNSITTLTLSGNTFSNISNESSGILNSSSIDTLILSGNIFSHINSGYGGVFNNGSITTFISSDNTFNDIDSSGYGIFNDNGSISTFTSSNDTFSDINNYGILHSLSGGNTSITISDDTFSGGTSAISGFATTIEITGGSLCLDFTSNTATPSAGTTAYKFTNTGGTFNSTSESTTSNNVGQFSIGAGVTFPGTCTP